MPMRHIRQAVLVVALLSPGLALGETQWMGQINQWSVGFEAGAGAAAGEPYCRLLWNSELGPTVEFRASKDATRWLIAKDGWTIPAGKTTIVTIVDSDHNTKAPAAFFDTKTLQLWTKAGKTSDGPTRQLVTDAFQGRPDLQLRFAGSEPDWSIPISRVQTLYPEFVQCMQRLRDNARQTASADPF